MLKPILKNSRSFVVLTLALLTALIGSSLRIANASNGSFITDFYAGCSNFNVDVTLTGLTDEGGGLDKFRYQLVDGAGHVLYQEDATRPVKVTAGNVVYNVAYQNGAVPTQNPVAFEVIQLDKSGNPGAAVLESAFYNASCLPNSGKGYASGVFEAPNSFIVPVITDSALYNAPGGIPTAFKVHATENWLGVYRTADNSWVAVYTNGNVLGWLPASVVGGSYALLPMRATHIERVYANGIPDGLSVFLQGWGGAPFAVHSAPGIDAPVIGIADGHTVWQVTGQLAQSEDERWVRIVYNGQNAWIWYYSYWVRVLNGSIGDLPIVSA